jgi:hypothetical protein
MATRNAKTLSENLCVKLEERRISQRMGLPISPFSRKEMRLMSEATTTTSTTTTTTTVDYFHLPRSYLINEEVRIYSGSVAHSFCGRSRAWTSPTSSGGF